MNDFELRRSMLQYAYDHRSEHTLKIVEIDKMSFLSDINSNRILQTIIFLRDEGLVKPFDSAFKIIAITTPGINLIENTSELNQRFPVEYKIPEQTKKLVETVEELLQPEYISALGQFQKAKRFLYVQEPPDYLNCIKESVGAVEALVKNLL